MRPNSRLLRLLCLVFLSLAFAVTVSFLLHKETAKSYSHLLEEERIRSRLCGMTAHDLDAFIWSHRAFVPGCIDASVNSTAAILNTGIRRFDVDVCIDISGDHKRYVVAHPAFIRNSSLHGVDIMKSIQSVDSFLEQIHAHSQSSTGGTHKYFVTLEPKFDDHADLLALIELVEKTSLAWNVAIIAKTVDRLKKLNLMLKEKTIGIALAFPSIIASSSILAWDRRQDYLTSTNKIYMPDIDVLLNSQEQVDPDLPTICWIVDDEELLWKSVALGVAGVLSNRPAALLAALRRRQSQICT